MAKFEIEVIHWVDSSAGESKWHFTEDDLEDHSETLSKNAEIASVGFVILETDDVIVLTGHINAEANDSIEYEFHCPMRIPKVCVFSRKKLE